MSLLIKNQEAPLSPSNLVLDEATKSHFNSSAAEILAQAKAESKEAKKRRREQAEKQAQPDRMLEAFHCVRHFTENELQRELGRTPENREFLEHWAHRIAKAGRLLGDKGLAECLDRSSPAPREKSFAIEILKLGRAGRTDEIVELLEEAESISEPPAPNFSGLVNDWLRNGLIEEIFTPKTRSPVGNTDKIVESKPLKKPIPKEEANILVREYLRKNPSATVKEIKEATEVSSGAISQSMAWKAHQAAREINETGSNHSVKTIPLTPKMQESLGVRTDPSEAITAEEAGWRHLIETAKPEERARLNRMHPKERAELIRSTLEQLAQKANDGS